MNRKSHIFTLTFALLLALSGVRLAAQTDSTSAADPAMQAKVQQHLQQISTELNLTDDQKQKIQPILQSELQQAKSVHDDSSLSPDQKKAKMQEIHASMRSQIGPILTPEQKVKFAAMKEQAKPQ
jgi:Spy/CpxP family protein refolding chaperone